MFVVWGGGCRVRGGGGEEGGGGARCLVDGDWVAVCPERPRCPVRSAGEDWKEEKTKTGKVLLSHSCCGGVR